MTNDQNPKLPAPGTVLMARVILEAPELAHWVSDPVKTEWPSDNDKLSWTFTPPPGVYRKGAIMIFVDEDLRHAIPLWTPSGYWIFHSGNVFEVTVESKSLEPCVARARV